jgi:hypothetical protein
MEDFKNEQMGGTHQQGDNDEQSGVDEPKAGGPRLVGDGGLHKKQGGRYASWGRGEHKLELDMGEDEAEQSNKHLAMAIYYSRKSYNPRVLMTEMLNAWGIQKLVLVEKVGDYLFKMEFNKEEEKLRVLDGGPCVTRVMPSSYLTMMVSLGRLKSASLI